MDRNIPVASHVKPLAVSILFYTLHHSLLGDAHGLHQGCHVLQAKVPIGTSVRLPGPGRVFDQDLLTAKGAVAASPTVGVASDLTVRVPDVVSVLLVERVIRGFVKGGPPEDEAFFEIQPNALEEKGVLQAAKVLQMGISAQGFVEV